MSVKKVVGVAIAAGVIYYALTRKKLLENIIVSFAGIKFEGGWNDPKVIIQLRINNPTQFTQTIKKISGRIILNDSILIGEVIQDQPQLIDASNFNIFELPININFTGILNTIAALLRKREGKYTFKGSMVVNGFDIPINESFNY